MTAAGFAAQLGAKVALIEKNRIGGDCTWTGCIPSKALLKAARAAHQVRTASRFGIAANPPVVELAKGARPHIPPIAGLREVPFLTYEQIFDNDRLPRTLIVVGGGPVGMEVAQAYQRLGAQVTVVADRIFPKDDSEVAAVMQRVFEREGVRFVWGRANSARKEGDEIVVALDRQETRGDLLLIASGRKPAVAGLDLEAGVHYSEKGIPVDDRLRTNVKHIYAAGDVAGGYQFTHFAGWQAFQATRNALLPGGAAGLTDPVPWVTFTDPEAAHIGLTEAQARAQFGENITIRRWEMSRTGRAICEDDRDGFVKLIARKNGSLLGATVVNARAGETITEFILAIQQGMKVSDLAGAIHAYPTYSTAVQQVAAELTIEGLLSGPSGKIVRALSRIVR